MLSPKAESEKQKLGRVLQARAQLSKGRQAPGGKGVCDAREGEQAAAGSGRDPGSPPGQQEPTKAFKVGSRQAERGR